MTLPRMIKPELGLLMLLLLGIGGVGLGGCTQASKEDRKVLAGGFTDYVNRSYDRSDSIAATYIQKFPEDPNVDEAYYLRGVSLVGKGQPAAAAENLHTAIAKSKRPELKAKAFRALGDMAFEGRRFEQAIGYYKEALLHYPTAKPEPMVLYRLGASYQDLGQWAEARPQFERAIPLIADPRMRQRAANRAKATAFSLQFGAFTSQAGAQELSRKIIAQGIRTVVVSEISNSTTLYMVRAGAFRDYATADETRRQLIGKYPLVTIVP